MWFIAKVTVMVKVWQDNYICNISDFRPEGVPAF